MRRLAGVLGSAVLLACGCVGSGDTWDGDPDSFETDGSREQAKEHGQRRAQGRHRMIVLRRS